MGVGKFQWTALPRLFITITKTQKFSGFRGLVSLKMVFLVPRGKNKIEEPHVQVSTDPYIFTSNLQISVNKV